MKYLKSCLTLSLVLMIFFIKKSYGQNVNGRIIYAAEFITNKNLPSTISRDRINYVLSFNKSESVFKKQIDLKNENENKLDMVTIFAGNGVFYNNFKTSTRLNQKEYYGELFLINTPLINWTLTNEEKMIGNYSCFKATAVKYIKTRKGLIKERKIVAWFSPQISANFGPKEYNNLPGLILELQEGNLIFSAIKIELNIDSIKIVKPTRGKKVSLNEYDVIVKKMTQDFIRKH